MRHRKKTSALTWAVLLLILLLAGWAAWDLLALHVIEPGGPVSISEAEAFGHFSIPPTATQIRIAGYRQWLQYERYIRFEAPVADCENTASSILAGEALTPVGAEELSFVVTTVRPSVFRDFSWFDLQNAKNVVTGGGGPGKPYVWIDRDRGVFYYKVAD